MFQAEEVHNPFRYTGEYTDEETGYIYLRARMYDPGVGRFISEDPIKSGLNWYAYCGGNPVNYTDPWGLEEVILAFIASKNEGSVTYYEENFFGLGSWNQKVVVTINGIEKAYTIGKKDSVVRIVNDKSIIDNEILKRDFNIMDESKLNHEAGDRFDREGDAVLAFGLMYHQKSLDEQQEYSASINKDKNGKFYYDNVTTSSQSYNKETKDLTDTERLHVDTVLGNVGIVHTHWSPDGYLEFSPDDNTQMILQYAQGKVYNYYLINRNKQVYYARPETVKEAPKSKKLFSY